MDLFCQDILGDMNAVPLTSDSMDYSLGGTFPADSHILSVVVVEDSTIVRERLVALIEPVPHVRIIGQAADGLDALKICSERHPDVLILDIELPGLNGLKVLEKVKREYPACRVVVLTTYAFAEFRQRCALLGGEFFLNKALDFERLPVILAYLASPMDPHYAGAVHE